MALTWLFTGYSHSASLLVSLAVIVPAFLLAAALAGLLGLVFERLVIRPVYGDHLKQILVTVGGAIIIFELIPVAWGPLEIPVARPEALRGSIVIGGMAEEKYRSVALFLGRVFDWLMNYTGRGAGRERMGEN